MTALCHPCKPGQAASDQDRMYGPGQRVFTTGAKSRCTVCGREAAKVQAKPVEEDVVEVSPKSRKPKPDASDSRSGGPKKGRDKQQSRPGRR